VLFEKRGRFGVYNENHPEEFESSNHPLILTHKGVATGVIRVDIRERVAWFLAGCRTSGLAASRARQSAHWFGGRLRARQRLQ
jgi:hypothetical protein